MVPPWAISELLGILRAFAFSSLTTASTAISMPRFRSIGFMPDATALAPSLTIAWARTVAVVVPSPARSLVFDATSRSICAPIFSNLSLSSISLATVTPSLVMRGAPKLLSMTTLRPLGPRGTFTASARMSTPRMIRSRASREKRTSFAAMSSIPYLVPRRRPGSSFIYCAGPRPAPGLVIPGSANDAQDVAFLHDQQVFTVDLHLGARPFAEQDLVAGLDIERRDRAVLAAGAGADRHDLALLGLFL